MIQKGDLLREFDALPPSAQRQVAEFIAALRARPERDRGREPAPSDSMDTGGFVGMWSDREDLCDSTAWVRQLRAGEWG